MHQIQEVARVNEQVLLFPFFFFFPMKPVNENTSCLDLTDRLYTCAVVLLAGNAVGGY